MKSLEGEPPGCYFRKVFAQEVNMRDENKHRNPLVGEPELITARAAASS